MIGEADPRLSMSALQAAAGGGRKAILDRIDPLATLAAKTRRQVINGKLRCHRAVSVKSNPGFYTSDAQPLPRRAGRPHSGIGLGEGRSLPRVRHAKHVGW
jgi:hypothetical protein